MPYSNKDKSSNSQLDSKRDDKISDATIVVELADLHGKQQNPDKPHLVNTGHLTKRSHLGETLRDSEIRYRRLFEAARDGILILDAVTGRITDVNPFLVELLDYSREELLGKELWEIGLFRDIKASKSAFRELLARRYVRYDDLPLKTKDGRSINVEFVSNVYEEHSRRVIQCNIRDITKRKYAERSAEQLREGQKVEALGQLAGGMAHDFNNLLGVILGYCEVLEKRVDLAEPTRTMIAEIHTAGKCANELTRHLLAFSRRQVLQPVFLDLNATVKRVSTMLDRMIGGDIELVSVLQSDLGTVKADPNQVEQVLMNLAVNARDAMPQGGKITIKTANIEIDEAYARRHNSTTPGHYVMLAVSDTGIGMDGETQSRVFEPFFSTKKIKGTGLGLSTVFGIVKQSAGTISIQSAPGRGTTFEILFPMSEERPSAVQQEKASLLSGGSETILLVEDTAPLRLLTKRLLEDCGYTVLDSGNPMEAISMAGQHEGPLPLMITDVMMPGISGLVLAERLISTRPETRVLYTSGYADDAAVRNGALGPNSAFLEKPFTRDDLIRKVRELLDLPLHPSLQSEKV